MFLFIFGCVFRCEVEGCGLRFLLPSKLKAHSKIHKGYSCDAEGCNEKFVVWSALRAHKSKNHPKSMKFLFHLIYEKFT